MEKQQDVLQAVVVASFFHKNFWPAADRDHACLVPLANRPLIHYPLDMLEAAGVADVVVFCPSGGADRVRRATAAAAARMNVVYASSDTCRSLGDVLRHLDACALIRGDFVLLWGNAVGRLPLLELAARFKALRQRRDKGAVMTTVCQRTADGRGGQTLALDARTGRVLYHTRRRGRLDLPLDAVLDAPAVRVRRDLADTGVALCSAAVPPLFADNFDFQTMDDFVKGLLINEEILNSTLYVHELDGDGCGGHAGAVSDWPSYQRVTRDVLRRWTYPQVPELYGAYGLRHGNVYLGERIKLAHTCRVGDDTMVGPGSAFGADTLVRGSVVGAGCAVGDNVAVEDSYLFDGVRVRDNCVVRGSVVGAGCTVGENCKITDGCVLGDGVVVEPGTELRRKRVCGAGGDKTVRLSERAHVYDADGDSDSDDGRGAVGPTGRAPSVSSGGCTSSSDDDDDTASVAGSVPDDLCMFYTEVVDSLIRGFEDHVHCDNLILEINSSRYAYNINYREANFQVIRAMLTLDSKAELEALNQVRYYAQLQSKLDYFLPVLKNYIKNVDSCEDCLSAIEDTAKGEEMLNVVVPKVIHHLYDVSVLSEESILKWHQKEQDSQFAKNIREKTDKLVQWLKEAEEETDSDEDEDSS